MGEGPEEQEAARIPESDAGRMRAGEKYFEMTAERQIEVDGEQEGEREAGTLLV